MFSTSKSLKFQIDELSTKILVKIDLEQPTPRKVTVAPFPSRLCLYEIVGWLDLVRGR